MDPSRCGVLLGSDKHGMALGPWLLPVSSASLWKRAALPWSTLLDLLWYHRSKTTNQAALGWNSKTTSQENILAFKLTISGISRQGRKGQNKRFSRKGIRGDLQVEKNQCAFSASKTWRLKNESVVPWRDENSVIRITQLRLTGSQEGHRVGLPDREITVSVALPGPQSTGCVSFPQGPSSTFLVLLWSLSWSSRRAMTNNIESHFPYHKADRYKQCEIIAFTSTHKWASHL